jgi:hypothetical protein
MTEQRLRNKGRVIRQFGTCCPAKSLPKDKRTRISQRRKHFVRNLTIAPLGTDPQRDAQILAAWLSAK